MVRDPHATLFRFRLGVCVRWAGAPAHPLTIVQRRWTERDILHPVVEYLCRLPREGTDAAGRGYAVYEWIDEPDLVAWKEHADG